MKAIDIGFKSKIRQNENFSSFIKFQLEELWKANTTQLNITSLAGLTDLEIFINHMVRGYMFWGMLCWSEDFTIIESYMPVETKTIASILPNSSIATIISIISILTMKGSTNGENFSWVLSRRLNIRPMEMISNLILCENSFPLFF